VATAAAVVARERMLTRAARRFQPPAEAPSIEPGSAAAPGPSPASVPEGDYRQQSRKKLDAKFYESELAHLNVELVKLLEWIKARGLKVVVLFEGRDAAGKTSCPQDY
jgi:hypothetical protein